MYMTKWKFASSAAPIGDEDAARDQRADDSPEQHAVLQVRRHREVRERHQEDEQVVDGQRLLDQPRLEELQRAIRRRL